MNLNKQESSSSSSQLFQSTIAKISVAQICRSIGFTGSQTSALEALSNIATRYLETLAKSASSNANTCGRTQCNLFDLVVALEDLNSIRGFTGASNLRKPLFSSQVLKDIIKFVYSIDEIPFAKPIPRRNSDTRLSFSRDSDGEVGKISHIPYWVPRLPDPSTYKKVDVKRILFPDKGEDADCEIDYNDVKSVKVEKKSFLPVKRPKVKFKFGVDSSVGVNVELGMRNGVCRGGKRVCWRNVSDKEDIMSLKRSREDSLL